MINSDNKTINRKTTGPDGIPTGVVKSVVIYTGHTYVCSEMINKCGILGGFPERMECGQFSLN